MRSRVHQCKCTTHLGFMWLSKTEDHDSRAGVLNKIEQKGVRQVSIVHGVRWREKSIVYMDTMRERILVYRESETGVTYITEAIYTHAYRLCETTYGKPTVQYNTHV